MAEPGPAGGTGTAVARIGRFAAVGVLNTAIDLATFALLYHAAGLALMPAHVAAFSLAVANSYVLNKLWTFRDASRGRQAALRGLGFLAVALGGLGVSSAIVWTAHFWMPAMAAKLAGVVGSFAWNYWASSRLVFRQ
jgi:putative flippase GtrA